MAIDISKSTETFNVYKYFIKCFDSTKLLKNQTKSEFIMNSLENITKLKEMMENNEFPEMYYFMNERESDVLFIIDGQIVPALKQTLALKSTVFRTMFFSGFRESNDRQVVIEDTTYEAFKTMVLFVYTEQLMPIVAKDYILAIDVYKLSHRYELNRLRKAMEKLLHSLIDMSSIESIYILSFNYKEMDLFKNAKNFVEQNFAELMAEEEMRKLKRMDEMTDKSLFDMLAQNYVKRKSYTTFQGLGGGLGLERRFIKPRRHLSP